MSQLYVGCLLKVKPVADQETHFQVAVTFAYACFCMTTSERGVSALLDSSSPSPSLFCWTLSQDTSPPAFVEQMFPKMTCGRV